MVVDRSLECCYFGFLFWLLLLAKLGKRILSLIRFRRGGRQSKTIPQRLGGNLKGLVLRFYFVGPLDFWWAALQKKKKKKKKVHFL